MTTPDPSKISPDPDPIVEEARAAGRALFQKADNDLHAVADYLRQVERDQSRQVVAMAPRPPQRAAKAS